MVCVFVYVVSELILLCANCVFLWAAIVLVCWTSLMAGLRGLQPQNLCRDFRPDFWSLKTVGSTLWDLCPVRGPQSDKGSRKIDLLKRLGPVYGT